MGGARTGGVRFLSYGVADVFAFPAPSHFIGISGGAVFASLCVVAYSGIFFFFFFLMLPYLIDFF